MGLPFSDEQAGSGFKPQAGPELFIVQCPECWYAKKTSGSGRFAECEAFISELYRVLHRHMQLQSSNDWDSIRRDEYGIDRPTPKSAGRIQRFRIQ
jgi:hypothetical protein